MELKIATPSLLANADLAVLDLKSFVSTFVDVNCTEIQCSQLSFCESIS